DASARYATGVEALAVFPFELDDPHALSSAARPAIATSASSERCRCCLRPARRITRRTYQRLLRDAPAGVASASARTYANLPMRRILQKNMLLCSAFVPSPFPQGVRIGGPIAAERLRGRIATRC